MTMVASRSPTFLSAVRLNIKNTGNDTPPRIPLPRHQNPSLPFLSISKPSWVVRTESNVWKEKRKQPDPPCVVCLGSGRVDCHDCCGRGRTNFVNLRMLPNGEWPKWCRTCKGSGLGYCSRCVGTGEYRYIMGFQFMKRELNETQNTSDKISDFSRTKPAGDLLINDDQGVKSDKVSDFSRTKPAGDLLINDDQEGFSRSQM